MSSLAFAQDDPHFSEGSVNALYVPEGPFLFGYSDTTGLSRLLDYAFQQTLCARQTTTHRWSYAGKDASGIDMQLIFVGSSLTRFAFEKFASCKFGPDRGTSSPACYSIVVAGSQKWAAQSTLNAWHLTAEFNSDAQRKLARTWPKRTIVTPARVSPAARALENVKQMSELTTEAIAPLIGVSRRTLHLWLNGNPISQRNEERLRALEEAISAIAAATPGRCREVLMQRVGGVPRIYDLLAEGQYETAIARATGEMPAPRPAIYPTPKPPAISVVTRLSALESKSLPLDGQIDRQFTRRLALKK